MEKFIIGQKQAEMFARLIYKDIHNFCLEHKEEYEAFLKDEKEGVNSRVKKND